MRLLKLFLLGGLFILGSLNLCWAGSTASIGVQAQIPQQLELSYWIRYAPPGGDPYGSGSGDATSINFGKLSWDDTNGIWVADKYYTVFLVARTSGRPYRIVQTCTGLVNGSYKLDDSFVVTPDYQANDEWSGGQPQGPMPSGDSLGTSGLAVATNKVIYNGNSGKTRIIRAYYGLATGEPGKPGKPITGDQPSGTYTGTVTFTVTLQ